MPYLFTTEHHNDADYAAGRVFYSLPGHPAFPVRLASEIFQRCLALRAADGLTAPCALYDPCCGGAYHLATLAYLHGEQIAAIAASDIDEEVLRLARRNLDLLTPLGLGLRIGELEHLWVRYGKASHMEALDSAGRLRERLLSLTARHSISLSVFHADAAGGEQILAELGACAVDVVITDVPYNRLSAWQGDAGAPATSDPLWQMLEALRPVLAPGAVVAIASDKGQKAEHAAYHRADRFQIGKRRIVLLRPVVSTD
jgi:23S rRNA (guanine2535-N1)-methyltransferase